MAHYNVELPSVPFHLRRWQRNKDLTWYSKRKRKDNDVVDEAAAEREAIKCQDAEVYYYN